MLSFFGLRLKFNKLNIFGLFATLVLEKTIRKHLFQFPM